MANRSLLSNNNDKNVKISCLVTHKRYKRPSLRVVLKDGNGPWMGEKGADLSDDDYDPPDFGMYAFYQTDKHDDYIDDVDRDVIDCQYAEAVSKGVKFDDEMKSYDFHGVSVTTTPDSERPNNVMAPIKIEIESDASILNYNVPIKGILESCIDETAKPFIVNNSVGYKINDKRMPLSEDLGNSNVVRFSPTEFLAHEVFVDEDDSIVIGGYKQSLRNQNVYNRVPRNFSMTQLFECLAYPDAYFTPFVSGLFGVCRIVRRKNLAVFEFDNYVFEYNCVSTLDVVFDVYLDEKGTIHFYGVTQLFTRKPSYGEWQHIFYILKFSDDDSFVIDEYKNIREYTGENVLVYLAAYKEMFYISSDIKLSVEPVKARFKGIKLLNSVNNCLGGYKNLPGKLLQYLFNKNNYVGRIMVPGHLKFLKYPFGNVAFETNYPVKSKIKLCNRVLLFMHEWSVDDHLLFWLIHYDEWDLIKSLLGWASSFCQMKKVEFIGVRVSYVYQMLIDYVNRYPCPICDYHHSVCMSCDRVVRSVRFKEVEFISVYDNDIYVSNELDMAYVINCRMRKVAIEAISEPVKFQVLLKSTNLLLHNYLNGVMHEYYTISSVGDVLDLMVSLEVLTLSEYHNRINSSTSVNSGTGYIGLGTYGNQTF